MLFNSLVLLLFAVGFYLIWYLLRSQSHRLILLIIGSFLFYSYWDWGYLFLLVGSGLIDFFAACAIPGSRHRRRLLVFSVVSNVGSLACFKYAAFAVDNLNWLLHAVGLGVRISRSPLPASESAQFHRLCPQSRYDQQGAVPLLRERLDRDRRGARLRRRFHEDLRNALQEQQGHRQAGGSGGGVCRCRHRRQPPGPRRAHARQPRAQGRRGPRLADGLVRLHPRFRSGRRLLAGAGRGRALPHVPRQPPHRPRGPTLFPEPRFFHAAPTGGRVFVVRYAKTVPQSAAPSGSRPPDKGES